MPSFEVLLNGVIVAVLKDDDVGLANSDRQDPDEKPLGSHATYNERIATIARMATSPSEGIGVTFQPDGRWRIRDGKASTAFRGDTLRDADVVLIRVVKD